MPGACQSCGEPVPPLELLGLVLTPPLCPDCGAQAALEDEQLERDRRLERALREAGATARLLRYSLASHPDQDAVAAARAWLDEPDRNLWLYGPVGTGKTGLAWGIVRDLVEAEIDAFYDQPGIDRPAEPRRAAMLLRWADLLDDLRASLAAERRALETGEEADPALLLVRAERVPVLALDDLGRERPTPWALERLVGLVNERYERDLPTIITSNYGVRELALRLGQHEPLEGKRIVERLVENARGYRFHGKTQRQPVAS